MRKISWFLVAPLLFTCLFALPVFAQEKWEYKVVNLVEGLETQIAAMSIEQLNALLGKEVTPEDVNQTELFIKLLEKKLNDLGNQGWELVITTEQLLAIFKRKNSEILVIVPENQ